MFEKRTLVLMVAESASLLAASLLRGFAKWGCQTHFGSPLLNRVGKYCSSAPDVFAQCDVSLLVPLNETMFGLLRQAVPYWDFLPSPPVTY